MTAPRFLYHGTSAAAAEAALREGLRPRSAHGKTNWKRTIESNPDAVYLTDAYPLYFGLNADEKAPAVIQLDTSKLDTLRLVPDEDVLEQAGRGRDGVKGGMKQRTRWYRKHLDDYLATDKWQISLQAMGTCGSLAPIPPEAISRVAFIDAKAAPTLCFAASDAMICLANYRFCGAKYRNLTNRIFGLPLDADPLGSPAWPDTPEFAQAREGQQAYDRRIDEEIATAVRFETLAALEKAA